MLRKRRWRRVLSVAVAFLVALRDLSAQNGKVLRVEDFIDQVKQYHPVAKQAAIMTEKAAAGLLAARGGFDPSFSLNQDEKTFDGTNYYRYSNAEIKLPTIVGVTLKSGIENNSGQYANPEITKGGVSYLGIEVPLAKGLLIDKQRAALREAKIVKDLSVQERAALMNDLLFSAYQSYFQWVAAYELNQLYESYLDNARKRLSLVKITFINGDRAAADTIEAAAQLQNLELLKAEAALLLASKTIELSLFLWDGDERPYGLSDIYVPDTLKFRTRAVLPPMQSLLTDLSRSHPELRQYDYKLQILNVQRRLKLQNLLPAVNLRGNLLSKGYYEKLSLNNAYLNNNYKFGLSVKLPLLLRQERGAYRQIRLKVKETSLQLVLKDWELQSKIKLYYAETLSYAQQIETALLMYRSYQSLLKVEELKFSQGESSLFLINARENKALELRQKLIELQLKYVKSFYSVLRSAGALPE